MEGMGAVGVWRGIPALLSPFTLTLTLSHQGRGDIAAARVSPVEGEGRPLLAHCESRSEGREGRL